MVSVFSEFTRTGFRIQDHVHCMNLLRDEIADQLQTTTTTTTAMVALWRTGGTARLVRTENRYAPVSNMLVRDLSSLVARKPCRFALGSHV